MSQSKTKNNTEYVLISARISPIADQHLRSFNGEYHRGTLRDRAMKMLEHAETVVISADQGARKVVLSLRLNKLYAAKLKMIAARRGCSLTTLINSCLLAGAA